MTSLLTEKDITERLQRVIDPLTGQDIITAGLISGITLRDKHIGLMITIEPGQQEVRGMLPQAIEDALLAYDGIEKVTPVLTAQTSSNAASEKPAGKKARWNLTPVEGVSRVIAIASGKGGVGKSTVTASLAYALKQQGKRVGIVDADIYGPSIPHMMGLSGAEKPDVIDGKMVPPIVSDIRCMSIGLLLDASQATIMRGPMVSKALQQLIRGTSWAHEGNTLDYLLIDMPPGTGDIHLSLMQQIPLSYNNGGAIVVTTPQEVALLDTRKCIVMFEKTHVPILGVIENMSWFTESNGERVYMFGKDGGQTLANDINKPLLAQMPIVPALGHHADTGRLSQYFAQPPHPLQHAATHLTT